MYFMRCDDPTVLQVEQQRGDSPDALPRALATILGNFPGVTADSVEWHKRSVRFRPYFTIRFPSAAIAQTVKLWMRLHFDAKQQTPSLIPTATAIAT